MHRSFDVPNGPVKTRACGVEYPRTLVVTRYMQAVIARLLRIGIGPVALILAAALLGAFRPVLRFHTHRPGHSGAHQPILLSETTEPNGDDQRPPARTAVLAHQRVVLAFLTLLVSIVALVLKARQAAFAPVAIRRLKLPRAAADSSPSS